MKKKLVIEIGLSEDANTTANALIMHHFEDAIWQTWALHVYGDGVVDFKVVYDEIDVVE